MGIDGAVDTGALLSSAEVADMLGIAEGTVRYWRHVGRGPAAVTLGGRVRYQRRDVWAWLREQRAAQPMGAGPSSLDAAPAP
jgi:excisionase family DNA binding protein